MSLESSLVDGGLARLGRRERAVRRASTLLILLLVGYSLFLAVTVAPKPPCPDNYVDYGYAIAQWGVFGDPEDDISKVPEPGMGRAPLYPLFLAGMMRLDADYRAMALCYLGDSKTCDWSQAEFVHAVQLWLMIGACLLLFATALAIGANPWLAFAVTVLAAPNMLDFVAEFRMSEALALPLAALFTYAFALWYVRKAGLWAVLGAGAALGLLALTRLAYVYFMPFLALTVILLPRAGDRFLGPDMRRRLLGGLLFVLGFAAVTAPWYARNAVQFGVISIGDSAGDRVMASRVNYDRMSLEEGLAAILLWLPDPGPKLGKALFPKSVVEKFDFKNPHGYRQTRFDHLYELEERLPAREVRRTLMREMFADPVRHGLTSVVFAVRGLRDLWLFVPLAIYIVINAALRGVVWPAGLIAFSVLNIGFHAGLTHFRARYGMPMVFGLAPLTALALTCLLQRFLRRKMDPSVG